MITIPTHIFVCYVARCAFCVIVIDFWLFVSGMSNKTLVLLYIIWLGERIFIYTLL